MRNIAAAFASRFVAVAVGVAPMLTLGASGCDATAAARASIVTPPVTVDLDAARSALEAQLCADDPASSCAILRAIDASDGAIAVPHALPVSLPSAVRVPLAEAESGKRVLDVDVERWLSGHELMPPLDVPFGTDELDDAADDIARTDIGRISVSFEDDTLALDIPETELVITDGEHAALIGTVSAHAGGSGEPSEVWLVDGGAGAMLRSLTNPNARLLLAVEPSLQRESDETLKRPGGSVAVSFTLELAMSTADLVQSARGSAY